MNVAEWLVRSACRSPDAPALLCGTSVLWTYQEFSGRAARLAKSLMLKAGVTSNSRVGIFLPNTEVYLEALYATWFAGAIVAPVDFKLHPREVAWIANNCNAAVIITISEKVDELAPLLADGVVVLAIDDPDWQALYEEEPLSAPVERSDADIAWLFHTSGTTGRPKGAMLSHGNLQAMAFAYLTDVDQITEGDALLYAAPMSHGAGLYNVIYILRGGRHVIPQSTRFDPDEILELGRKLRNVSMFAAPTMVRRLVAAARRNGDTGEGLRAVIYGGAPMYLADIEEATEVMGSRFIQIYGQGESPMTIARLSRDQVSDRLHPRWRSRLASVGCAYSCTEIKVVDEAGRALPPGTKGEIILRGPSVMQGYWNDPESTQRVLRNGWLWTGDVGAFDDDGFLTLLDRSKDVIISGGTNIYPREVEEALLAHPDVKEVSVVGRASAEWGEDVVAFVVTREAVCISFEELDNHCISLIARFKRPKEYVFLQDLPKSSYGKILKSELRNKL